MRRLKILTWPIHGSYFSALAGIEHDWYLPVKQGRDPGYEGRGPTLEAARQVHDVPAGRVKDLELDLVLCQSPRNYFIDRMELLGSEAARRTPTVYLEHNTPRPYPVDTRHPAAGTDQRNLLLVHVTHFNRLMWDQGGVPTAVVEHSVSVDPNVTYRGSLERGITVINGMPARGRRVGYDIFLRAREQVPLDVAGMDTESFGGLGDIPYRELHRRMAEYRFLFSPIRYTSLPLSVIEALTIGMPVVALATTELPSVIQNGHNGYISCDVDELVERMRFLLANPDEARRLGANARVTATRRFSLDRFAASWNGVFERALTLGRSTPGAASLPESSRLFVGAEGAGMDAATVRPASRLAPKLTGRGP